MNDKSPSIHTKNLQLIKKNYIINNSNLIFTTEKKVRCV